MGHTLEQLTAVKTILSIAGNCDDDSIPTTHFQLLKSEAPDQWLCCHPINLHTESTIYKSLPLISDLTACITHEDCFLTTHGDITTCGSDEKPIISCWLKSCPDPISQSEWNRMIDWLCHIFSTANMPLEMMELIQYGLSPYLSRLQVSWTKTDKEGVCAHPT